MNPLAIFVFMDLFAIILIRYIHINGTTAWHYIYANGFHSWLHDPKLSSTVFSLVIALIWIIVSYIMFKFKIFIKI
jgi:predicted acyltransferase